MSVKTTVVIPVFNGEKTIVDCIESILANQPQADQLIVIDDASTDSTPALLARFDENDLQIITNPQRLGAAESRNLGLQAAHGDVVFFTDADCGVDAQWIRAGLASLSSPAVIGVEGQIVYGRNNPGFVNKIPCNPFYHQAPEPAINKPGQDFAAANIAFRRDVLLQAQGFNATDFREGREDTDLGWRAKKFGKIAFATGMKVTHAASTWTLKSLLQNSRRYQKDVTFLKHHGFFFFKKGRVLHPQFLLMLLFPPLIIRKYHVRTRQEYRFALSFYLYLFMLRCHIWRSAIRSRIFVI